MNYDKDHLLSTIFYLYLSFYHDVYYSIDWFVSVRNLGAASVLHVFYSNQYTLLYFHPFCQSAFIAIFHTDFLSLPFLYPLTLGQAGVAGDGAVDQHVGGVGFTLPSSPPTAARRA